LLEETFTPGKAERIYQECVQMMRWSVAMPWSKEEFQRSLPPLRYQPAE
jgi:hypothetical protein